MHPEMHAWMQTQGPSQTFANLFMPSRTFSHPSSPFQTFSDRPLDAPLDVPLDAPLDAPIDAHLDTPPEGEHNEQLFVKPLFRERLILGGMSRVRG